MGGKKTETNSTSTTTIPAWMTGAGQDNYNAASAYVNSPDAQWSDAQYAKYANPFVKQVQDRTVMQMGDQNKIEHANLNDQVQAAKAWGGSRQGVLEAAQAKDQNANMLDYLARSNADSYDSARSAFESDRAAKLGGWQTLTAMLAGTPRNTTTTGNQTQVQGGSFMDTLLGVGQLAASAAPFFSDRRLKKDTELLGRDDRGLGTYRFRYLWEDGAVPAHVGVMADEVEALAPEALGPIIGGYRTVNYGALGRMFA